MSYQVFARKYRPQVFEEVLGQDAVVRTLRNAIKSGRLAHAYLFVGPRGVGKTSTARIFAKALNCAKGPTEKPCGECSPCREIAGGNSLDVLEIDGASNNGVEQVRELRENVRFLPSQGKFRIYLIDEVHMLSTAAFNALLKTLEEPPEHVVFVLATTDPQKVSETIRSRVQHLQFHLLPLDDLEEYVRHVISDAGLQLDDAAVAWALESGGGSARDTLSALELAASGGGDFDAPVALDELLESLVARDQGRALAAVAFASRQGRDARTFAEDTVRTLRDAFLSLMAPELVALPADRAEKISATAQALGAAAVVRAMEVLGETLVEMRHAADPRLLLDVAVMKLSAPGGADGVEGLTARIAALEESVRTLRERLAGGSSLPPAPRDPATGRARPGSRAATSAARPTDPTSPVAAPASRSADASSSDASSGAPPVASPADPSSPTTRPADTTAPTPAPSAAPTADPAAAWPRVLEALKPLPRAIFKPAAATSVEGTTVTVTLGNAESVKGATPYVGALEAAVAQVCGAKFTVALVARESGDDTSSRGMARPGVATEVAEDVDAPLDPAELSDAAPSDNPSIERLKAAFPGAQIVVEGRE